MIDKVYKDKIFFVFLYLHIYISNNLHILT